MWLIICLANMAPGRGPFMVFFLSRRLEKLESRKPVDGFFAFQVAQSTYNLAAISFFLFFVCVLFFSFL